MSPELRLTDPGDVDIYSVKENQGKVGMTGSSLGGRVDPRDPRCGFVVGSKEINVVTDSGVEETTQSWDGKASGGGASGGGAPDGGVSSNSLANNQAQRGWQINHCRLQRWKRNLVQRI